MALRGSRSKGKVCILDESISLLFESQLLSVLSVSLIFGACYYVSSRAPPIDLLVEHLSGQIYAIRIDDAKLSIDYRFLFPRRLTNRRNV